MRCATQRMLAGGLCLAATALAADRSFTVAVLRIPPGPAGFEHRVRKAAARGAELVAVPERFHAGDPLPARLARELRIYLAAGFTGRGGRSVVVFSPDGSAGGRSGTAAFDTPLGRWGLLPSPEWQAPEAFRVLALRGAQVVLVPSAGDRGPIDDLLLRTRAYENGVWTVFAHPERALVIDPRGRIAAQDDPSAGEQAITARITPGAGAGEGPMRHRRPEIYGEILGPAVSRTARANFTIAGLQMMPERWNKEANLRKMERYAREAAARGAEVVVTPEGFLEGYVANDKAYRPFGTREQYFSVGEAIDGPLLTRVAALARELKIYLALGFAERRGGRMYNSVALFSPAGTLAGRYAKSHTADDEPYNTKGAEFPVIPTPFGPWGTLICMDRQLPETSRILAVKGAQVILIPAWGGYGETNDIMMRTRAYENGVWLAFVHPKRCLIVDPRGNVVAQSAGEEEQIVTARVQLSGEAILFRRPEAYGDILK